jgi:hypothetical protein
MKLYKKGEQGQYTFIFPHTGKTGNEILMRDPKDVPFPGGPFSVGMSMSINGSDRGAVILSASLMDPTWADLDTISGQVNRAWRVAYESDTNHTFFECASLHADTLWLWFGS